MVELRETGFVIPSHVSDGSSTWEGGDIVSNPVKPASATNTPLACRRKSIDKECWIPNPWLERVHRTR